MQVYIVLQVPYPNITWRREDGRPIFRESHKNKGQTVGQYETNGI